MPEATDGSGGGHGRPVVSAARNKTSFEWSAVKGGTLKSWEQKMEVRRGRDRQEVEAKFRARENETTLEPAISDC